LPDEIGAFGRDQMWEFIRKAGVAIYNAQKKDKDKSHFAAYLGFLRVEISQT
jgi:hypothetical protein